MFVLVMMFVLLVLRVVLVTVVGGHFKGRLCLLILALAAAAHCFAAL